MDGIKLGRHCFWAGRSLQASPLTSGRGRCVSPCWAHPACRDVKVLITLSRYYFCTDITREAWLRSIKFLLSENMALLIFLYSQAVKTVHMFSAPIQRNPSFTPYFMPYVGS